MGFFKKIFRGVKKVFKKIGRGIKKVAMGIGKFMNKIGIVGQIALMFIPIPGLGQILSSLGGWAARALTMMGPIGTSILKGAQFVIGAAGKFVTGAKNIFGTITGGIKTFFGEFTKTALNKIGFDPVKFGFKSATEGGKLARWLETGKGTFGEAWGVVQENIVTNAGKILDPWRSNIMATSETTLKELSDSSYHSIDDLKKMNPQITDWKDLDNKLINLDPDFIPRQMIPQGGWKAPVTTQEQYEEFWKTTASNIESQAVSELGSPKSILSQYKQDPISGPMTLRSAEDFQKVMESATPSVPVEDTGFFNIPSAGEVVGEFGKELLRSTAMDTAKSWIAGDPPEAPARGYIPDILPAATTGRTAPLQFDFSMPSGWTDGYGRDSAGMYDGRNTYAAYMKSMMGTT